MTGVMHGFFMRVTGLSGSVTNPWSSLMPGLSGLTREDLEISVIRRVLLTGEYRIDRIGFKQRCYILTMISIIDQRRKNNRHATA
jgi:hypothetical protein